LIWGAGPTNRYYGRHAKALSSDDLQDILERTVDQVSCDDLEAAWRTAARLPGLDFRFFTKWLWVAGVCAGLQARPLVFDNQVRQGLRLTKWPFHTRRINDCQRWVNYRSDAAAVGKELGVTSEWIENYRWQPKQPTRFIVIDRHTGHLRGRWEAEPIFCFHHVNAYDDVGGDIVIDLCAYPDTQLIDALYLDRLNSGKTPVPQGRLRRYRLTPSGSTAVDEPIDTPLEWPRINYSASNARAYRYAYGAGAVTTADDIPAAAITKLDLDHGAAIHWPAEHCYVGEPVFVPRPGGHVEDDGVVLSIVFDPQTTGSFLLVLDGRDLAERARVHAPHRIPFGFHGNFFPTTHDRTHA
jgi:carotenoid cleavage dioxygenase-like enzyme